MCIWCVTFCPYTYSLSIATKKTGRPQVGDLPEAGHLILYN